MDKFKYRVTLEIDISFNVELGGGVFEETQYVDGIRVTQTVMALSEADAAERVKDSLEDGGNNADIENASIYEIVKL